MIYEFLEFDFLKRNLFVVEINSGAKAGDKYDDILLYY